MTDSPDELITELIDLGSCSLRDLRRLRDPEFEAMMNAVRKQVERPRANLGGSGPPGRAD